MDASGQPQTSPAPPAPKPQPKPQEAKPAQPAQPELDDHYNPKVITPMGEEVPASLAALIEYEEPMPMMP